MAKKKAQTETTQARVLGGFELDGVQYNPDDVIEASPKLIEQLASSVDAHPDAVDYCLRLDKPVVKKHAEKPEEVENPNPEDPDGDQAAGKEPVAE